MALKKLQTTVIVCYCSAGLVLFRKWLYFSLPLYEKRMDLQLKLLGIKLETSDLELTCQAIFILITAICCSENRG